MSLDVSVECLSIHRPTHIDGVSPATRSITTRSTRGVGRAADRVVSRHSADVSVDVYIGRQNTDTRPTHRPTVGRHGDRESVDIDPIWYMIRHLLFSFTIIILFFLFFFLGTDIAFGAGTRNTREHDWDSVILQQRLVKQESVAPKRRLNGDFCPGIQVRCKTVWCHMSAMLPRYMWIICYRIQYIIMYYYRCGFSNLYSNHCNRSSSLGHFSWCWY